MRSHSNDLSLRGGTRLGLVSIVRSDALPGRTKNVVSVLFVGDISYYDEFLSNVGDVQNYCIMFFFRDVFEAPLA